MRFAAWLAQISFEGRSVVIESWVKGICDNLSVIYKLVDTLAETFSDPLGI